MRRGCADYVIDTPLASSEYHIESVSVPFYSLVFRGYVPMGSESVNLSENWDKAILRCAESGLLLPLRCFTTVMKR